MLKKTLFALSLSACFVGFAQEQADVPKEAGDSEVEVKIVDVDKELSKLRRKIRRKGFTAVRTSEIGAKPTTRDYVINRRMAFDYADFLAKQEIAKSLNQKVSSAMSSKSLESHGGLTAKDLEGDAEFAKLVNKAIYAELKSQGVDLNDKNAVKSALPKLKGKESFKKRIEIASQSYLIGVSTYASASSKDKVGVLAYSSETLREIAEGMVTGKKKKYAPGKSIDDYFEAVEDKLANTYGVRVMIDEKGDPCLVAFAQREILSSEDSAKENAGDAATAMIREFAGTAVMLKKAEESNRSVAYLEPVNATDNKAVATASASVRKEAQAEAEAIDFSGITEFDSGIIRLPSGDKIAWSVKYWTPTTAKTAIKAYDKGKAQQQAIKGGVGNAYRPKPVVKKKAAKKVVKRAPVKKYKRPAIQRQDEGSEGVAGGELEAL